MIDVVNATGRRAFLAGAAALPAALALPSLARGQSREPRRIDVHQHFIAPAYLRYNRAGIVTGADADPTPVLRGER